jgi:hypothetical protein
MAVALWLWLYGCGWEELDGDCQHLQMLWLPTDEPSNSHDALCTCTPDTLQLLLTKT